MQFLSGILFLAVSFLLFEFAEAAEKTDWYYSAFPAIPAQKTSYEPVKLKVGKNNLYPTMKLGSKTHPYLGIEQAYMSRDSKIKVFVKRKIKLSNQNFIDGWIRLATGYVIHLRQDNQLNAYFVEGLHKSDLVQLEKQLKQKQTRRFSYVEFLVPCANADELTGAQDSVAQVSETNSGGAASGTTSRLAQCILTKTGEDVWASAEKIADKTWEGAKWAAQNPGAAAQATGEAIASGAQYAWDYGSYVVTAPGRLTSAATNYVAESWKDKNKPLRDIQAKWNSLTNFSNQVVEEARKAIKGYNELTDEQKHLLHCDIGSKIVIALGGAAATTLATWGTGAGAAGARLTAMMAQQAARLVPKMKSLVWIARRSKHDLTDQQVSEKTKQILDGTMDPDEEKKIATLSEDVKPGEETMEKDLAGGKGDTTVTPVATKNLADEEGTGKREPAAVSSTQPTTPPAAPKSSAEVQKQFEPVKGDKPPEQRWAEAEKSLARPLNEKEKVRIEEAHRVGMQKNPDGSLMKDQIGNPVMEPGRDATKPAGLGNYTQAQINEKNRILRGCTRQAQGCDDTFTVEERRRLFVEGKVGYTGDNSVQPATAKDQDFKKLMSQSFRPRAPANSEIDLVKEDIVNKQKDLDGVNDEILKMSGNPNHSPLQMVEAQRQKMILESRVQQLKKEEKSLTNPEPLPNASVAAKEEEEIKKLLASSFKPERERESSALTEAVAEREKWSRQQAAQLLQKEQAKADMLKKIEEDRLNQKPMSESEEASLQKILKTPFKPRNENPAPSESSLNQLKTASSQKPVPAKYVSSKTGEVYDGEIIGKAPDVGKQNSEKYLLRTKTQDGRVVTREVREQDLALDGSSKPLREIAVANTVEKKVDRIVVDAVSSQSDLKKLDREIESVAKTKGLQSPEANALQAERILLEKADAPLSHIEVRQIEAIKDAFSTENLKKRLPMFLSKDGNILGRQGYALNSNLDFTEAEKADLSSVQKIIMARGELPRALEDKPYFETAKQLDPKKMRQSRIADMKQQLNRKIRTFTGGSNFELPKFATYNKYSPQQLSKVYGAEGTTPRIKSALQKVHEIVSRSDMVFESSVVRELQGALRDLRGSSNYESIVQANPDLKEFLDYAAARSGYSKLNELSGP